MLEKNLNHIEFMGESFPYKCTIGVLEKLQDEYGTLNDFEREFKFRNQEIGEDGRAVLEIGIGAMMFALSAMIAEGMEIEPCKAKPPTDAQLRACICDEYGLHELFHLVNDEFGRCFDTKKNGKATQGGAGTHRLCVDFICWNDKTALFGKRGQPHVSWKVV